MKNGDKNGKKTGNDNKVIHFPASDQRNSVKKAIKLSQKQRETQDEQSKKKQERLEDDYRRQYRLEQAERAQNQVKQARTSAGGKQPFINWDKIPPFTRFMVGALLAIHLVLSFAVSDANYVYILQNFAFIPAKYTGGMEWSMSAIIAPVTSLFIHAGWMHLIVNLVMALAMGMFFERVFGARAALVFFIISGVAGNLVYLILDPMSLTPVIGASGAINGLFAATLIIMVERGMMGPEAQKRGPFPIILFWASIMILIGLISSDTSWQSHLGGFFCGVGLLHLWKRGYLRV